MSNNRAVDEKFVDHECPNNREIHGKLVDQGFVDQMCPNNRAVDEKLADQVCPNNRAVDQKLVDQGFVDQVCPNTGAVDRKRITFLIFSYVSLYINSRVGDYWFLSVAVYRVYYFIFLLITYLNHRYTGNPILTCGLIDFFFSGNEVQRECKIVALVEEWQTGLQYCW